MENRDREDLEFIPLEDPLGQLRLDQWSCLFLDVGFKLAELVGPKGYELLYRLAQEQEAYWTKFAGEGVKEAEDAVREYYTDRSRERLQMWRQDFNRAAQNAEAAWQWTQYEPYAPPTEEEIRWRYMYPQVEKALLDFWEMWRDGYVEEGVTLEQALAPCLATCQSIEYLQNKYHCVAECIKQTATKYNWGEIRKPSWRLAAQKTTWTQFYDIYTEWFRWWLTGYNLGLI